jgi:uncharacterized damage-inducible protein DinB
MRKLMLFMSALPVALVLSAQSFAASRQQSPTPAQSEDKTAPSYDMKAQAALDLQQMQQKFVSLAQAIPQEKYSWKPSEGVRNVGEIFLHTAAASFNFPPLMGTAAAAGFDGKNFEKSTADKAKIVDWLNRSFAYSINSVQSMSNADFAKLLPKLGPQANAGDVVYLMVVHDHEMLGQAIAYARSIGVVPPWTAAAQKQKNNPQTDKD